MGCVYSSHAKRSEVEAEPNAPRPEPNAPRPEPNAPMELPMIKLIKTKRMLYVENIQITFREEYIKQKKRKDVL